MQNRQPIPSDDEAQRLLQSTLFQGELGSKVGSQVVPPTPSDVFNTLLENLYIFRDTPEIQLFIGKNPFLIPLLKEAYIHIKRHFLGSDVVLEVVNASEAIDKKQLVAFIVVKRQPEDASQALDRLDEEWWLDNIERAKGRLCIALEYKWGLNRAKVQNRYTPSAEDDAQLAFYSDSSYSDLEGLYTFREKESTVSFLETYPFLIPLLKDIRGYIDEFFPSPSVILEAVTDPETGETELIGSIVVEKDAEGASDALDLFDDKWDMDIVERSQDLLLVTLEFI